MKIAIEIYRGYDINFDTEEESFECVASPEHGKQSKSYKAVKGFIDEFIKNNMEFKPFIVRSSPTSHDRGLRLKIIGIRKDGKFITENGKGEKGQISIYSENDYVLDREEDEILFAKIVSIELEKDAIQKRLYAAKDAITATTLKSLKEKYLPR